MGSQPLGLEYVRTEPRSCLFLLFVSLAFLTYFSAGHIRSPRGDFPGQPLREDLLAQGVKPPEKKGPQQLQATFRNTGKNPSYKEADLYYDEGLHWGKLGFGDPALNVNTYEGETTRVLIS